jgi:hypothetical protein
VAERYPPYFIATTAPSNGRFVEIATKILLKYLAIADKYRQFGPVLLTNLHPSTQMQVFRDRN